MADPYIREQFANMDCETAARRERANVARLDDALVARVRELVERDRRSEHAGLEAAALEAGAQ
jgi:hypothetical protein